MYINSPLVYINSPRISLRVILVNAYVRRPCLKYTGKDRDPATGLYYFNARWYDAAIGQFTTEDPARDGGNWYLYVGANPLGFVDPSGLTQEDMLTVDETGGDADSGEAHKERRASLELQYQELGFENYDQVIAFREQQEEEFFRFIGTVLLGTIPVVGEAMDVAEVVKSLKEGDVVAAGIALGAVFAPEIIEQIIRGGRGGIRVLRETLQSADEVGEVGGRVTVHRVFGGDARAQGFSWTTQNPQAVENFRNVAGLPSGGASGATNSADFMITGRVKPEDVIESRRALPLDGNEGGLPELIIDPKDVDISDFRVLNP